MNSELYKFTLFQYANYESKINNKSITGAFYTIVKVVILKKNLAPKYLQIFFKILKMLPLIYYYYFSSLFMHIIKWMLNV
jgi:hypothetical protein